MNQSTFLLLFPILFTIISADICSQQTSCQSCANATDGFLQPCSWCLSHGANGGCFQVLHAPLYCHHINTIVGVPYNCPVNPPTGSAAYSDLDGRRGLFWASTAYTDSATQCLSRQMPDMVQHGVYETNCNASGSIFGPDDCHAFIGISSARRVVVLSFRGTLGVQQIVHELTHGLSKVPFPAGGRVNTYFDHGFATLFNRGGIKRAIQQLSSQLQGYTLWVTGHSLGGAMAALAAVTVANENIWPRSNIRLITYGEPRVGDVAFASTLNRLLPNSYRVIHKNDPVPHIPPMIPGAAGQAVDSFYHHRFEVWYNNDMGSGATYNVCHQAEDGHSTCSGDHIDVNIEDHLHYFGTKIPDYAFGGCATPFHFG